MFVNTVAAAKEVGEELRTLLEVASPENPPPVFRLKKNKISLDKTHNP